VPCRGGARAQEGADAVLPVVEVRIPLRVLVALVVVEQQSLLHEFRQVTVDLRGLVLRLARLLELVELADDLRLVGDELRGHDATSQSTGSSQRASASRSRDDQKGSSG